MSDQEPHDDSVPAADRSAETPKPSPAAGGGGIVAWFADNRVAAFLVSITIILAGIYSLIHAKVEVFPEFDSETITISVLYPGASPEEVEEGIVRRIEEKVFDLTGIRKLSGTATEGVGAVAITVEPGHDVKALLDRVKTRVDGISTLPVEAERPVVEQLEIRRQVIDLAVHGPVSERILKRTAERIRDDLMTQPGVTLAEVFGSRNDEITIEVSEATLRRYALTFTQVADAVRLSSLDLPAGNLRTEHGEILVRTRGQAYSGQDFATIPVVTRPDGSVLRVGDLATIRDAFTDSDAAARFDGAPAMLVRVYRVGNQSALTVAEVTRSYAKLHLDTLPAGVEMTVWNDTSVMLKGRIRLLLNNGWQGLILVVLTLALFLKPRVAIWVALGIPVSMAGGLWLMPLFGVSINMISLFAFILVLGIVVDDAIVVGENITHERDLTPGEPLQAARRGVSGVALAVTLSVLTTVAMFTPMLSIPGLMGKIWAVIPAIAIPVLLFSLLESLFVLPAHLGHSSTKPLPGVLRILDRIPETVNRKLEGFLDRRYVPFVRLALRWRYVCLSCFIGLLAICVAIITTGLLPFSFFPKVPADQVTAAVTLPPGSSSEQTAQVIARLEQAALTIQKKYADEGAPDTVRHIMATIASRPGSMRGPGDNSSSGSDPTIGEVIIALQPGETRKVATQAVAKRWRELVGAVPEAQDISFGYSLASAGKAVEVQLSGPDSDELADVAETLKKRLATFTGVYGIADTNRTGKRELVLQLKPAAATLGLRERDIARQVRAAIYGEEAQRVLRGRDEVKVMVRLPEAERSQRGDLDRLRIRTADGREVPLTDVATMTEGSGFTTIRRAERQRIITVSADIEEGVTTSKEVNDRLVATILPEVLEGHPHITWSQEGEARELKESMTGLLIGFVVALYIAFFLMAVLFKSVVQPLVILSIIPFGLIGAVGGHLVMGLELSLMSFMGLVALAGIEINDSIVLVDFINRARAKGMPLHQAVADSGRQRFRAIMLTTLTTFFGLLPVMIAGQLDLQARFLVPMAVALGFGGLFVTAITLVLVPSLYLVAEDVRRVLGVGSHSKSER